MQWVNAIRSGHCSLEVHEIMWVGEANFSSSRLPRIRGWGSDLPSRKTQHGTDLASLSKICTTVQISSMLCAYPDGMPAECHVHACRMPCACWHAPCSLLRARAHFVICSSSLHTVTIKLEIVVAMAVFLWHNASTG